MKNEKSKRKREKAYYFEVGSTKKMMQKNDKDEPPREKNLKEIRNVKKEEETKSIYIALVN